MIAGQSKKLDHYRSNRDTTQTIGTNIGFLALCYLDLHWNEPLSQMTLSLVFSVALACWAAAMEPKATSMVESTAMVYYRKVPAMC